ncbi:MAG TPA: glycosyltransferase family 2 protein [Usitatibacter sp.]|nr:glycosyltransferase family 2 protein [Usitatibacter sp.]
MTTASITIAFNPEPAFLLRQLEALAAQVDVAIIVDNGSTPPVAQLPTAATDRVRIVRLASNEGVARGFNVGIEEARRAGADRVLLLDQDSVPAAGMVDMLHQTLDQHLARGERVAAVGPRISDPRDRGDLPFVRLGWFRNRHLRARYEGEVIPCDFLISSGALLPLAALAQLGAFEDDLFIDNVDLEWCCRARSRGYSLYGVTAAVLEHRLGDGRRRVPGGAQIVVHSPDRIYYMTRNRFLLYRREYMPLKWKLKDALRAVAKFAATMLWVAPRAEYARMTWRAVRDAVAGRTGKLPG